MATYAPTAADVTSTEKGSQAIAGEAIEAGELIYLDASDDNKAKLADADGAGGAAQANVAGVAINSAAADQPVSYLAADETEIPMGSIFTSAGKLIVLGDTPGKMMDAADLASSDWVTVIGVTKDASTLQLRIDASGIQVA